MSSPVVRHRIAVLALSAALTACGGKAAPAPAPAPGGESAPVPVAEPAPERFASRLDELTTKLEAGLAEHHLPGMAVAVVHNDSVIYAHGFGYANLDSNEPVTPRTLFAIGSSTKAFTATLIGQLVDEGKIGWDDALTKHVPEFALDVRSDESDATATIRDALCHRTGFTRMGVLWASGNVSRKEFLAQASHAQPAAGLRERFLYNNVTYTAAGEASARVAGVMWSELAETRILQPLGMGHSLVLAQEAKEAGMAQGYLWEREKDSYKAVPMRSLDEIAPAGAINSSVLDMTAWVRFQLGKGQFEGKRLIEEKTLAETWKPQVEISPDVSYGLGWFIEKYEGKTMLHHGGNIDGYAAMVSFIPEEDLGFVMLSNVSYTPMQSAVRGIVYDTLLGDAAESVDAASSEDLGKYEGDFVARFGPFAGKNFAVSSKDGVLFVDVPGQQNYELAAPDDDGKRAFALTDTIKVSFGEAEGKIVSLHLFQGGFDFEMFREGYTPPPEIPLEKLSPLLGQYEHDKLGRATVLVRNNRLAIDVPGQMVYELFPPADDGMWKFRVKDDVSIEFVPRDRPKKVVLHQGGQTFELTRNKGKAKAGPSTAAIAKIRKEARAEKAIAKTGAMRMTAKIKFLQAGIEGTVSVVFDREHVYSRTDLGKYGWSESLITPTLGWEASSFGPTEDLAGRRLEQGFSFHPWGFARSLAHTYEISVEGTAKKDGKERIELVLSRGDLPAVKVQLDPKTGDVLEAKYEMLWAGPGGVRTTEKRSDYRKANGLRMPYRIESKTVQSGTVVVEVESYEVLEAGSAVFPTSPPQ